MEQKRKLWDILFGICFVVMIFVPFIMLDTRETIDSELENRSLTKWPGLYFDKLHMEWYGHYVEDRVGFRDQAILLNGDINYNLFGRFSETMHMFGKEGYVFPADEGYIGNYQRLNVNEDLVDDLVSYLSGCNSYAKEQGSLFVFLICPNKSSVYGDHMPESIYVDESRQSVLELTEEKLEEQGILTVIPHEKLHALSAEEQVYNVKYDCAHWNDLGAFYGLQMVDEKIEETYDDIPVMEREDFALDWEEVNSLEFYVTRTPIRDRLPKLSLIAPTSQNVVIDSPYRVDVPVMPGNIMAYYYNEDAPNDKTILILHDSFMDTRAHWYTYRYKEVYFAARVNYAYIKDYMDLIRPDVVLFELAERSFADDLGAYDQLGTYWDR